MAKETKKLDRVAQYVHYEKKKQNTQLNYIKYVKY